MRTRLGWCLAALFVGGCASAPADDLLAPCAPGPASGLDESAAPVAKLPEGDIARGARLFASECSKCHSPRIVDRSSRLFRSYPRLDCPDFSSRASDAYLAAVILRGGPAVGLEKTMRPFAEILSPSDLADLIAFLRSAGT